MNTREEVLERIRTKYEEAVRTEPAVALPHRMFCIGEVTEIESLKLAIVALIEIQEALRKQVLNNPLPVVIFKNEPPVSAEQVDPLVQSMGIPVSLMTADGCNYSGNKVAHDMFYGSQMKNRIQTDKDKYKGTGEYRPPKKGEFYFSTMSLRVEQARFDFESEQHIYTLKEPHAQRTNK